MKKKKRKKPPGQGRQRGNGRARGVGGGGGTGKSGDRQRLTCGGGHAVPRTGGVCVGLCACSRGFL